MKSRITGDIPLIPAEIPDVYKLPKELEQPYAWLRRQQTTPVQAEGPNIFTLPDEMLAKPRPLSQRYQDWCDFAKMFGDIRNYFRIIIAETNFRR